MKDGFYEIKDLIVGMRVDLAKLDKIEDFPIFFERGSMEFKKGILLALGLLLA